MDLLYVLKNFATSRQSLILSFFPRYCPCKNMFQCSRNVLDFPELFQNYANHDFQNFFPWTVIEPASRALLEQIKDFANPIFVLEQ